MRCFIFFLTWCQVRSEPLDTRKLLATRFADFAPLQGLLSPESGAGGSCLLEDGLSDEEKRTLVRVNCKKVKDAADLFRIASLKSHKERYQQRYKEANDTCAMAQRDMDKNPTAAAELAIPAWEKLVHGQECCSIPRAPFCSSSFSLRMMRVAMVASIVVLALIPLLFCCKVVFGPRLFFTKSTFFPHHDQERSFATRGLKESDLKLKKDLNKMWATRFGTMQDPEGLRNTLIDSMAALQANFGFQQDSVKNQFEEIISLLKSYGSIYASQMYEQPLDHQPPQGLTELICHHYLLSAATQMLEERCGGLFAWQKESKKVLPGFREEASSPSERLLIFVTYQLVWAEAANCRFMPESLYFITTLIFDAYNHAVHTQDQNIPEVGETGFLIRAIRPLYYVIFDAQFQSSEGKAKPREGYEEFFAEDCLNYDDVNELFLDFSRLKKALPRVFDDVPQNRYARYLETDLKACMKNMKTHRELHSFWSIFASTHRVWFLLSTMYFLSGWALLDGAERPETLAGSKFDRLALLGLGVAFFGLLRTFSRWFVTGAARRSCWGWMKFLFSILLWLLPAVTFLIFRLQLVGQFATQATRSALHFAVSVLGGVKILAPSCDGRWKATRRTWREFLGRWLFWIILLILMFWINSIFVNHLERAITTLGISRPGDQTWHEIKVMSFSPGWNRDVLLWLAFQFIGLVCYATSFNFYFNLASFFVAQILLFQKNGCSTVMKSKVCKIPENLQKCLKKAGIEDPKLVHGFEAGFLLFL